MRTSCVKNGLVVVVVLLFVGVAVQPSIADNHISSDNEKDCNICPKVSKLQDVKKYRELSDRINTLIEMNKELKPDISWDDNPIICKILAILMLPFVFIEEITILIEYRINPDSAPLLWYLLLPFIIIGEFGITFFCLLAVAIGCVDIHIP